MHDAFLCDAGGAGYGVIVMDEVVGGVTLERFRERAPLKDVAAAEALLQERLRALHGAGVVHGDLHSGNVMVVPARAGPGGGVRDVRILDFGFARTLADMQLEDRRNVGERDDGRRSDPALELAKRALLAGAARV